MNPFGAISGGAGGLNNASSASSKQETGGAGGFVLGPVNTGAQGIDKTTVMIIAAAAVLGLYLVNK